jgi:hypothetical protein
MNKAAQIWKKTLAPPNYLIKSSTIKTEKHDSRETLNKPAPELEKTMATMKPTNADHFDAVASKIAGNTITANVTKGT